MELFPGFMDLIDRCENLYEDDLYMEANYERTRYEARMRLRRKKKLIKAAKLLSYRVIKSLIFIVIGMILGFLLAHKTTGTPSEAENLTSLAPKPEIPVVSDAPKKIQVLLDPGHGGKDTGSEAAGTPEKTLNLSIALLVEEELKNAGIEVEMTRSSDQPVSLDERAALANENKVQAFVSIHQNSFKDDRSIRGLEVWYNDVKSSGAAGSRKLADAIHTYAKQTAGTSDRGTVPDEKLKVLRTTTVPACLIEVGYLTNTTDKNLIFSESYQKELAKNIARGIQEFLQSLGTSAE